MLGGAAVTEEVFPGFHFSECSYVVSLLRPDIIRYLDLARHGLEILPLDGTFTPMHGDYLWRVNDHADDVPADRAALENGRGSLRRVRARDGRDGAVRQADHRDDARRSAVDAPAGRGGARAAGPAFPAARARRSLQPGAADDDERDRLSRRVVRDRRAQGDDGGVGNHRHVPRRALAGHGVRAPAPLHGRDRRRVPLMGFRPGRHRGHLPGDRRRRARGRSGDPHQRAGREGPGRERPRHGGRSAERRRICAPTSCPPARIRG